MKNEISEGLENQAENAVESPVEEPIKYAGFWARFFASILDSIVLGIFAAVVMYLSYDLIVEGTAAIIMGVPIDWRREMLSSLFTLIVIILFWIYRAATPGKMMMGMSIADASTGRPASTGKLILRYFGYFVSIFPLFLGFIWIAFDERKQGFHDKIANTVVIMNPPKEDDTSEET